MQIRVWRQGGEFSRPAFQGYTLEAKPGQTVLEALFEILETQDGSLAFRYACRGAVCGSCAMHINGGYRLACATQLKDLGDIVEVRPLGHLSVIRDLVVDMEPFWAKYESLRPYLINASAPPEGKERLQSPEERARIDELTDCILCACCHGACTMTLTDPEYLGPALLTKVDRFASDSRDTAVAERVALVDSEHGVWRCHNVFNCAEVCPKKLHPPHSIAKMRRRALRRRLLGRA
jgi:succinate dehydrogenase / fumarate reductase, iron-sulfur subunit